MCLFVCLFVRLEELNFCLAMYDIRDRLVEIVNLQSAFIDLFLLQRARTCCFNCIELNCKIISPDDVTCPMSYELGRKIRIVTYGSCGGNSCVSLDTQQF